MKKMIIIGTILISLVSVSTACTKTTTKPPDFSTSSVKPATSYSVKPAAYSVDIPGVVKFRDEKNIYLDFTAVVKSINVKEGQKVSKGQSLITLNLDQNLSQIKSKEIEIDGAQNDINNYNVDILSKQKLLSNNTDPDIIKLTNVMNYSEGLYKEEQNAFDEKKYTDQYNNGLISQSDFNKINKTLSEKKNAFQDAKLALASLKYNKQKEISQEKISLDQATNKLLILQAELENMNATMNKDFIKENDVVCDVTNGIVSEIGVSVGDNLATNKKVLSVIDSDKTYVQVNILESIIKNVTIGSVATIVPNADKTKQFTGKVSYISNKAILANGETYIMVEVSIDNNDGFLLPNFNVNVQLKNN